MFSFTDAENAGVLSQKPVEEKAVPASPEQVFAECSQKRILGLLAAMLPPLKLVRHKWYFLFWKRMVVFVEKCGFWKAVY